MSTRNAGQNAMKHALAWARHEHGQHAILKALPSVAWIQDKKTGERRPISHREDLFGCADLLLLRSSQPPLLVQVTTWTEGGGVASRRNKAELWLRRIGDHRCAFHVIAWVRRTHFRRWAWLPLSCIWQETEPFWSPKQTAEVEGNRRAGSTSPSLA